MCLAHDDSWRLRRPALVSVSATFTCGGGGDPCVLEELPPLCSIPVTQAADNDKENTQPTAGSSSSSSEEAEVEGEAEVEREGEREAEAEGTTATEEKSPDDKEAKPKKNRCAICRKKVGLTGFLCRCGGLYCAVHRYSDKHNCTFDYRELGAQEIRRNNPVVVGEKIQKI